MDDGIEIPITFSQVSRFGGDMTRMQNEGEALLKGKHVISVGVKSSSSTEVEVFATCLQSSKVRDAPHEICIVFSQLENVSWQTTCSCKAGAGSHCKHIFAVMLFCLQ